MNNEIKILKSCDNCEENLGSDRCDAALFIDPDSRETYHLSPSEMRADEDLCGKEGKLFEPREVSGE